MKPLLIAYKIRSASYGLIAALTLLLSCFSNSNTFAFRQFAATSAVAPTGLLVVCEGTTLLLPYNDVVTICSSIGIRNPQTVTYSWKLDGADIPGSSGTFAAMATEYMVSAYVDVSHLTAGTHTLSVTYQNSVDNCGSTIPFNSADLVITVNPIPDAINVPSSVCAGATMTLTDATSGGSWAMTSDVASVDGSGIVTGIAAGTADVTYSLSTGCGVTATLTVDQSPANIGGVPMLCSNASATLTNATNGGNWTSSDAGVLSITPGTGLMTGVSAGSAFISYTLPNGCFATKPEDVYPVPLAITGPSAVCPGANITLTDATNGGTWSMAPNPNMLLDAMTGVLSGIAAGTVEITYSLPTGCSTSLFVTVLDGPAPISSPAEICMTTTANCADITPGGLWATDDIAVGSIDGSGVLSGTAIGSGIISYTISNGCFAIAAYAVSAFPDPIGGPVSVCAGSSITLTEAAAGGSWSSPASPSGFIDYSGNVSGLSAGTMTVSYTMPAGCYVTADVTVNPVPDAILSPANLLVGSSVTCVDFTAGGVWSSSDPSVASIDFISGSVTGESAGNSVISYTLVTGCYITRPIAITSSGFRPGSTTQQGTTDLTISPNPNNGVFTIAGLINVKDGEKVTIEITDMRGSIVYTAAIVSVDGSMNEQIRLSDAMASGMYMLRVRTSNENNVYKINVAR